MSKQTEKYVIERNLPGAGRLSEKELRDISSKSCSVLDQLGPSIKWIHSYVTADKIYCVYSTEDKSLIGRHAELGGFPANSIAKVEHIIDPSTAEL